MRPKDRSVQKLAATSRLQAGRQTGYCGPPHICIVAVRSTVSACFTNDRSSERSQVRLLCEEESLTEFKG